MKVLIDDEWKEFEVEFGEKMPEDVGGVEIIPSTELEDEILSDVGPEWTCLSVSCYGATQLLLTQYMHYGIADGITYAVQLRPEEYHTYIDLFG